MSTRDRLEKYTIKTYRQLLHREGDALGKLLAWISSGKQVGLLYYDWTQQRGE